MSQISICIDEDAMDGDLVAALRSRGVTVLTALDAGQTEKTDEEQLAFAAERKKPVTGTCKTIHHFDVPNLDKSIVFNNGNRIAFVTTSPTQQNQQHPFKKRQKVWSRVLPSKRSAIKVASSPKASKNVRGTDQPVDPSTAGRVFSTR